MMKIIFNNDSEHALSVSQINYNTVYQINNYTTRHDSLDVQLAATSLGNLGAFENTALTSMKILNNADEEISTIALPENFYITNSNVSFYENSNSISVVFGSINNE